MSKEKVRDLVVCMLAIIVLFLVITTNVFASEEEDIVNALGGNANRYDNILDEPDNESVVVNNTAKNNTAKNNSKNNSKNNTAKNNTSIPYTGVDHSVVFIIAVCGISAIYAYKKIRDYNNL